MKNKGVKMTMSALRAQRREDHMQQDDRSLEVILEEQRDSRISNAVDPLTLVLVGAHGAGKDTVLAQLGTLGRDGRLADYGVYKKVQYWTKEHSRAVREGEGIARNVGPVYKTREEILADGQRYVFWYRSGQKFYAFPPDVFAVDGIPMLHIANIAGLAQLEKNNTLPHRLTVFIDANDKQDLARRVSKRLVLETKGEFPADYDIHAALAKRPEAFTAHDRLFRETFDGIMQANKSFGRHAKYGAYDAVFRNNEPIHGGIRDIFYGNGQTSVIEDIALRLNEFYHRFRDANGGPKKPEASKIHNQYVVDLARELFSAPISQIQAKVPLNGKVHRAVDAYATREGLDPRRMHEYLNPVVVSHCRKGSNDQVGTITIYLKRQDERPISLERLRIGRAEYEHPDYHALRIIEQYIFQETRTRPVYLVEGSTLVGMSCSLTDRRPTGQEAGQYHKLRIFVKE